MKINIETLEISKLIHSLAFLVIWAGLFVCFHIFRMHYIVVEVILYAALQDLLLSFFITLLLYFLFLKKKLAIPLSNFISTILLGFTCGYIFSITLPTVIDRSLSAYILEKFVQRGGAIQEDALIDMFIEEFIPESQLMDIRLQEALTSGTLNLDDDCIYITRKGRLVATFTKFYRNNLLPKKRRLLDRVTDDLTDPFKRSIDTVDYTCQPSAIN